MVDRRHATLAALLGLALLAGCLDVTHEVTVRDDGTVEEYRLEMVMDEYVYNLLEAETEPGQSLEESIVNDTPEELPDDVGDVTADVDELDNGDYRLSIGISDFDPAETENITVEVEEDTIYYEDLSVEGGEFDQNETDDEFDLGEFDPSSQVSYEYILTMPGEIQDSNADEVDGDTATWDVMELESDETVWAESAVPDDSSAIPGLGVAAAVLAIGLAALGVARRRR
ncbi:MAG: hypothetical protein ACLFMX_02715 [Halobacteriales archaeon]